MGELGIRRFEFIGGEVTRFGAGWLDVVRHLRHTPCTTTATLTSGWFLEREDFLAVGRRYAMGLDLMEDLASSGVTHLTFSLDGPEPLDDRWRRSPAPYRRVLGLGSPSWLAPGFTGLGVKPLEAPLEWLGGGCCGIGSAPCAGG